MFIRYSNVNFIGINVSSIYKKVDGKRLRVHRQRCYRHRNIKLYARSERSDRKLQTT
jgi:hypothetical protein